MGVVSSAFITSGGPVVGQPVVHGVDGDEFPELDRPHRSVVEVDALGDGHPEVKVPLQHSSAILS